MSIIIRQKQPTVAIRRYRGSVANDRSEGVSN